MATTTVDGYGVAHARNSVCPPGWPLSTITEACRRRFEFTGIVCRNFTNSLTHIYTSPAMIQTELWLPGRAAVKVSTTHSI